VTLFAFRSAKSGAHRLACNPFVGDHGQVADRRRQRYRARREAGDLVTRHRSLNILHVAHARLSAVSLVLPRQARVFPIHYCNILRYISWKRELQELYGIEKSAATLAALIESQNRRQQQFEDEIAGTGFAGSDRTRKDAGGERSGSRGVAVATPRLAGPPALCELWRGSAFLTGLDEALAKSGRLALHASAFFIYSFRRNWKLVPFCPGTGKRPSRERKNRTRFMGRRKCMNAFKCYQFVTYDSKRILAWCVRYTHM